MQLFLLQFSLLLEYCSKGNLRSYLIDHQVEFRSTLTFYMNNHAIEMAPNHASTPHHDITLLYAWCHQVNKSNYRESCKLYNMASVYYTTMFMNEQIFLDCSGNGFSFQ